MAAGEAHAAADLLARAFRDNPLNVAVLRGRGEAARVRANRVGIRATLATALGSGWVWAAREAGAPTGVLIGTPPGGWPLPPPPLARRLHALGVQGPRTAARWAEVFHALAAQHPVLPHAYLATLGVAPQRQRAGLGRALLGRWLAEVDAARSRAWLETDRRENLAFYAAAGFEEVTRVEVLGVPVWILQRPAPGSVTAP